MAHITINDVEPKDQYTAIAAQTEFTVSFPFFEDESLAVYQTTVGTVFDADADMLTLTSDYTVTGAGNVAGVTRKITLVAGANAGDIITILRIEPIERTTDYQNSGDLLAETLNDEQDKEMMILQQLQEEIDRSLKLSLFESGIDPVLPAPVAFNLLRWNVDVTGLENVDQNDIATTVGFSNFHEELFEDGTDFTAGTSTQLTLANSPGVIANTEVFFDGVHLGIDNYSLLSDKITFDTAIPGGTSDVRIRYGTATEQGFINASAVLYDPDGTAAVQTNAQAKLRELVSIKDFGAVGNGLADDSYAWANFLAHINTAQIRGVVPEGTYYIPTAPGSIINAAVHNVPEVDYSFIDIECAEGVTFLADRDETDDIPGVYVTRPILKANSSTGGTFRWVGGTLDGNVSTDAEIVGSLGTGAYPSVAPMLEVRGFDKVHLEVEATKFAQNWDTNTPENGNGWRRGPVLIWGNGVVTGDWKLTAPTRREGFAAGNNRTLDVGVAFEGNADLTGEGNVSSPFDFVSGSDDLDVGGKSLCVRINDWSGAWTGSAINIYSPGDIVVDLNGKVIAGGNDGTNTATGASTARAGGGVFGKGIDIGDEISAGATASVTIKNGTLKDNFHYSILANRVSGDEIKNFHLDNVFIDGGWRGLIVYQVTNLTGQIHIQDCLQYIPTDDRFGVGITAEDITRGNLTAIISGVKTENYEAPNLDVPIADGVRYSQTGVLAHRMGAGFHLKLISHDIREKHVKYNVATLEHDTYYANVEIYASSSTYTALVDGHFFDFGNNASTSALKDIRIHPNSHYNGDPIVRSDVAAFRLTGSLYGSKVVEVGNEEVGITQDDLIGEYRFFNNDQSGSNPGVSAAVKAFAADANGRGAYLEFWVGDATNAYQMQMRINTDGSIEMPNLPTSDPAVAGRLWSNSGNVTVSSG